MNVLALACSVALHSCKRVCKSKTYCSATYRLQYSYVADAEDEGDEGVHRSLPADDGHQRLNLRQNKNGGKKTCVLGNYHCEIK